MRRAQRRRHHAPLGPDAGRRGSIPAFLSRRRESEAQRRPPAAGPHVGPTTICFPYTSAACRPLDLSRSYCPASLRRIWQVRQRNKVMGKIKLFPTAEYSSKQPSDPVVPCTGIFLDPSKSGDQHDSGAIPRSLRENLYLQSVHQYRRRLDPRQEVRRGGPRGEYRTGEGLLRRVGRGGAAGHHPEAAQDHRDIQEVGDEEAVSGADNLRRLRR